MKKNSPVHRYQNILLDVHFRKAFVLVFLLLVTLAFGTFSYYYIEHIPLFDALYMTIITISTVGFSEIYPLSKAGRVVTILVISSGLTIGATSIGSLIRIIVEGELGKSLGRHKLNKKIASLHDHYIICGYGRIGSLIAHELHAHAIPFVILENSPELHEQLEDDGYNYLFLDATNEEALLAAGIMRAKGIVTAVKSDADNVFITLTARSLHPTVFILARASEPKVEIKLSRAGATKVLTPYLIGGKRMAEALIRPTVVDFIDIAMMNSHLGLVMEETRIRQNSPLAGKNLIESNLRRDFGAIIVAIKKQSGEMIFNPLPQEKLESGDVLVLLGKKEDMQRLKST
jgi:voltage-gated potassium channel